MISEELDYLRQVQELQLDAVLFRLLQRLLSCRK